MPRSSHPAPLLASALLVALALPSIAPQEAAGAEPAEQGEVHLRLLSSHTGEPVSGKVELLRFLPSLDGGLRSPPFFRQARSNTQRADSDEEGLVKFRVECGDWYLATASGFADPETREWTTTSRLFFAQEDPQPQELVIELPQPCADPLPASGFVRSAEDGSPIEGAQIQHIPFGTQVDMPLPSFPGSGECPELEEFLWWLSGESTTLAVWGIDPPFFSEVPDGLPFRPPSFATSAADGCFAMAEGVEEGDHAFVQAPGWSATFLPYRAGTHERAGVEAIALARSASLSIQLEGLRTEENRRVHVVVSASYRDLGCRFSHPLWTLSWLREAGPSREVHFDGLPARTPLTVRVRVDGSLLQDRVRIEGIEPGIERELELAVPATHSFQARLKLPRAPGGSPLALDPEAAIDGHYREVIHVWEMRTEASPAGGRALTVGEPLCRLEADAQGRYEFAGLSAGTYLICTEFEGVGKGSLFGPDIAPAPWKVTVGGPEPPPETIEPRTGPAVRFPTAWPEEYYVEVYVIDAATGYSRAAFVDALDEDGMWIGDTIGMTRSGPRHSQYRPMMFRKGIYKMESCVFHAITPDGLEGRVAWSPNLGPVHAIVILVE